MADPVRILGIDPGSRITGYGVVDCDGARITHVASGCIRPGMDAMNERLEVIFREVGALIAEHQPAEMAIERVFVNRNVDSALKLGQARAAAICATFGHSMALSEYAARAIKQSVVGRGNADKGQVQHMIRALLSLPEAPSSDAADALAVALCHANSRSLRSALAAHSARRAAR